MSHPRIYAVRGAEEVGRRIEMTTDELTFGRSASNTIVLSAPQISAHHARIIRDPETGDYSVEDLGSQNGTFLAGTRIHRPEPLGQLDTIDLGGVAEYLFQLPIEVEVARRATSAAAPTSSASLTDAKRASDRDGTPPPPPPDAEAGTVGGADLGGPWRLPAPARAEPRHPTPDDTDRAGSEHDEPSAPPLPPTVELIEPPDTSPAPDAPPPRPAAAPELGDEIEWILEIQHDDRPSELRRIGPGEHSVGRDADCDIPLADPTLSRRHARLSIGRHGASVTDLGSTNKTYVDDVPIDRPTTLAHGSRVRFGIVVVDFRRLHEDAR